MAGVSEDEVCTALIAQGIEPSEEDVVEIQGQWQAAIEHHLLDFSSRALNEYHAGRSVLIVYEGSIASYLLRRVEEMLKGALATHDVASEEHNLQAWTGELRELLQRFSPREAIARFRALLPRSARYTLIDQLDQPVSADLYILP